MAPVAHLLLRHERFRRNYRIKLCESVGTGNFAGNFSELMPLLGDVSVLIYQPPIWATWGDNGEIYRRLMQAASSNVLQVTVPYAVFNPLWPCHHNEAQRSAAAAGQPDDRSLLFSYSDANVLHLVREGGTPQEIVAQYCAMDLPAELDLTHLKDANIARQRPMEAETDVKILDFILETYRADSVFNCINHPSNHLNLYITNQILKILSMEPLSYHILEQICVVNPPQIPIHPAISRHFDLKWATPDVRYQVGRFSKFTFEEYIYELASAYLE